MTFFFDIANDPLLLSAMVGLGDQKIRTGWVDPDKLAIVVLPFSNLSGDAEQEYFADGLTEDIIAELARFKNLFVISRNTTFQYKGRKAKTQDVGQETGAQYLVEGSIRKSGNRIRVTAQLIDTAKGSHLWAEKYDRALEDIFAVQDELVQSIAGAIPGEVDRVAIEQIRRKPPENLTAYDCELRGRWANHHWNDGVSAAIGWFERAVQADPNYALALAGLGKVYALSVIYNGLPAETNFKMARVNVEKATALDGRNPAIICLAAGVYVMLGEWELALTQINRAVALNPNDSHILDTKGAILCFGGNLQEALEWFGKGERIEPYGPDDARFDCLCITYYLLGQYEKVVRIHQALQNVPIHMKLILSASLAMLGRIEESRSAAKTYQDGCGPEQNSKKVFDIYMRMMPRKEDRDRLTEGFQKAELV